MAQNVNYEAGLERDYSLLTEKHKSAVEKLESSLLLFLKSGKGKPVTIQGPYGSGKTQLLYHLYKYVWDKGGIAVYTHLEKLLPEKVVNSSGDYTEYLKRSLNDEVLALRAGKSILMSGALSSVRDYALSRIGNIKDKNAPIVLLVDEIEQQYKILDERVRTDDHSPLKATLRAVETGTAGFYVVLGFAPVSFYEFSKGEAQTRSFLSIMLPVIKAENLRTVFGNQGNFAWWMGRGRYGWALKVVDTLQANLPNIDTCQRKELLDVCRNLGTIGGVPCIVGEEIEKIEDFKSVKPFLVRTEPHSQGGESYVGDIKVIKKCWLLGPKHDMYSLIEKQIAASKIAGGSDITYYLTLILDALSNEKHETPLFTEAEDWRALFSMVSDITLEFEGQERMPSADIEKLGTDPNFIYNIRHDAEAQAPLQEGYCLSPRFLHSLFPFPISSPNLVSKSIATQRETLGDQSYLAREELNGVSIVVLLNDDKTKDYLTQHAVDFLEETKSLLVVNLSEKEFTALPIIAGWLKKQGRLIVVNPRGILSDFLVSYFYWMRTEKGVNLPLTSLFHSLSDGETSEDKEKARKIRYYSTKVRDYIAAERPALPSPKYVLRDQTGFDGKVGFFQQVLGFAFVDNKLDWEAMHKFRAVFEKTDYVRQESNKKGTGVPTALPSLIVGTSQTISQSTMLKKLRDSFGKYLPEMKEIINELDRDKFASIPSDVSSKTAFVAMYYYLKEYSDPSAATVAIRNSKANWEVVINRANTLSASMRNIENILEQNVLLTHAMESDQVRLIEIGNIVAEFENKIAPYTKFLLSVLLLATVTIITTKLNEIEKRFSEFRDTVEDTINRYKTAIDGINSFDNDTFDWVKKSEDVLKEELGIKFRNICQEFASGGRIGLESIPDPTFFVEQISLLSDDVESLSDIDEFVRLSKTKAKEISKKLQAWELK